jgi:hypothetical protein
VKGVPGLFYYKNFLSNEEHQLLLEGSYKHLDEMKRYIQDRKPTGFVSKKHNLTSQESYNNVLLVDEDSSSKSCQVFEKYGEDGHVLVYFIGNNQIPLHIKKEVLPKLIHLDPVKELKPTIQDAKEFDWRLTVNYYEKSTTNSFGGFPFHRDIAANGLITSILTLESPALIEFIKPDKEPTDGFPEGYEHKVLDPAEVSHKPPIQILLEPKSLVVMSGM